MTKIWQSIRALLFYSGLILLVLLMTIALCLVAILPFRYRQRCVTFGNKLLMSWLRITCGVKIKIEGLENIPQRGLRGAEQSPEHVGNVLFTVPVCAGQCDSQARAALDTLFWMGPLLYARHRDQEIESGWRYPPGIKTR